MYSYVLLTTLIAFRVPEARAQRAVWVWERDAYALVEDPAELARALGVMRDLGVTTVYLYADSFRGRNLLRERPEGYRALNVWLRGEGITPYALLGSAYLDTPGYVLPQKRAEAEAMFRRVLDFNASSAPAERFDGVNIDIEPYLLPDWETNRTLRATQYLELSRRFVDMRDRAGQGELSLGSATPFWFDAVPGIVFEGRAKPLSEHVQDVHDYVALMDYRDFADGPDGILFHAASELAYADRIGKTLVIGVETLPRPPALEKVTFREEGLEAMEAELAIVVGRWGGRPGFGGVAIHHLGSVRRLLGR